MGPQQMSRTVGQWKRMGLYHCDTPVKRELTDTLEFIDRETEVSCPGNMTRVRETVGDLMQLPRC